MNKKFLLLTMILVFSGLSVAQTVEIQESGDFPSELTGGESFDLGIEYGVNVDREVPLSLELEVSSEEFDVPEEAFTVSAAGNQAEFENGVYRVNLEDSSDAGSVTLDVDSSTRLKSANYNFTLDLLSSVGVGQKLEPVEVLPEQAAEVAGEQSQITVRTLENGSASVTELDFVGANPPSDSSQFIGGVEVNVQNKNGDDIGSDSSGTVRINFDEDDVEGLDRESLSVYFYNESTNGWESVESTVGENYVEAEVDHFSVYSVFGEEEESSGGTTTIGSSTDPDNQAQEEQNETQGPEQDIDESEEQSEGAENEQSDEAEEGVGQDESETEESEAEVDAVQNQGLTGQFTEAASSPLGIGSALLLAVLALLVYTGRHQELVGRIKELR